MRTTVVGLLFGSALTTSGAQEGSWTISTADGVLQGHLSGVPGTEPPTWSLLNSIDAGRVGCPAASP